ncbi:MAG: response regulator [Deltaproteobacteria bacterium]|nr:response regulator [Deltaproteobacteria bacterium]
MEDRLDRLSTMALALGQAQSAAEIYDHALDTITGTLGNRRASVLLFDGDGVMRFKAWRELSANYRAAVEGHTPWSPGETGAVPLLLPDVETDPGLAPYLPTIRAEGIAAMAMIPLIVGGGVIGKFMVYDDRPRRLTPIEVRTAQAIGAFTAFAISRHRAVEALRTERGLFVGGPTVVFKWRNQPGWPVEYVSPNLMAQFGYSPEQLTSGKIAYASLVHPEDLERVAKEVTEAVAHRLDNFEQQYRVRRSDGEYREIDDFTVVERDGNQVTHFLGYVLDATARNSAAAALRAAERRLYEGQRLESLGILAGGIAHDFNNLLLGVLGNAGMALAELPDDSPARSIVEAIQTAGQRGADLTRQLLAYSGQGKFVLEPVDLSVLVGESGRLLATVIAKTATVDYQLAEGLPRVEADATQLRQVVMNLLTNASDALEDRPGTITVRTYQEQLSSATSDLASGEYVVVEVTDTGVGMDPATLAKVFDPFFTTKFHGRGLGMAAVLGIAKGHRGAIRLESQPGRGTKVRFFLPVGTELPLPVAPPPLRVTAPPAHATVLVVDDEKMVNDVAALILRRAGFKVRQAHNGQVALELLNKERPAIDLVLLDLTMPILSGEATLAKIREQWPELPVLLSSGFSAEGAARDRTASANGFIQKPYRPEALVMLVHATLGLPSSDPARGG